MKIRKIFAGLLVALLAMLPMVSALAQHYNMPEYGMAMDVPDDLAEKKIGIQPGATTDGNIIYLAFMYMDSAALAEPAEAYRMAQLDGDQEAAAEAYAVYQELLPKHSANYCIVFGIHNPDAAALAMCELTENDRKLGEHGEWVYYIKEDFDTSALEETCKAEMEAARADVNAILDSIQLIDVDQTEATVEGGVQFSTVDMEGNTVTQDIFAQADLTIVHVWGTFCSPCIVEMPELAKWAEELPANVQIIGIISDVKDPSDKNFAKAQKIIEKAGVKFINVIANDSLQPILSAVSGTPTTFFFDKSGNPVGDKIEGAYLGKYKAAVEAFLG